MRFSLLKLGTKPSKLNSPCAAVSNPMQNIYVSHYTPVYLRYMNVEFYKSFNFLRSLLTLFHKKVVQQTHGITLSIFTVRCVCIERTMPSQDVCLSVRPSARLSVRLSVCLSVTRRYSVDTAEHILQFFFTIR